MAAAAAALFGGPPSTPVDPAAAGTSSTRTMLEKGFTLPWWVHIFLTGIAPFMIVKPFLPQSVQSILALIFTFPHTFGVNGLNLIASNSAMWAAAKLSVNYICQTLADVITIKFAGKWWVPCIKAVLYYANPWYVFDMLQIWNPKFATEGYKIPFWNKPTNSNIEKNKALKRGDIGFKEVTTDATTKQKKSTVTYGLAGLVFDVAALALFLPAFYTFCDNLPPEMQAKLRPFLDMFFTIGGGLTALAGGGVGTFVLLPKLIESMQGNVTQLMAGGSESPQEWGHIQSGGNTTGEVPSIQQVAESLMNKGSSSQQGGGQGIEAESATFMGILAFTVLGGMSLALVRAKGVSGSKL